MLRRKIFLFILATCILLTPLFTACKESDDTQSKDTVSHDDTGFPLETQNFNTTIKVLSVETGRHLYGELQFVPDEEKEGNVVNDAVKRRNDYIEENFGITIEVVPTRYPGDDIALSITSGSDDYQIVADAVNKMLPNATQNYYWSLEDKLNLDKDWWDQNAIENLSITDKTYFVAGDALITDDDHTYLILFNKDMYVDNGLEGDYGDIYDFVRDGKWTYDAMHAMGKVVAQPDENDQWTTTGGTYGLLGDNYGAGILVYGSGIPSAQKTEDGGIQLLVDTERSVNAFNKVFDIMNDTANTIRVEQIGNDWAGISNMFIEGKGLFYLTSTQAITQIKNSTAETKVEFGVLPVPKLTAEQDNYYNGVNVYQSNVMAVPTTNMDKLDATIYLMEALGYYSKNTPGDTSVTNAYYEITLKLQSVGSSDDEEMLDLVFNNRLYDIGAIYDWGDTLLGVYSRVMSSGSNNFISHYESIKTGVEAAMEQTISDYQNITT